MAPKKYSFFLICFIFPLTIVSSMGSRHNVFIESSIKNEGEEKALALIAKCTPEQLNNVSIDIVLFNTTVQFSEDNSCFAADDNRDCKCDKLCIKHQDCCLDYEIWRASVSNSSVDGKINTSVILNWKAFIGDFNSPMETPLNTDVFQQTLHEIENKIMGRKKNLVEFTCNVNVVDCGNNSCDVFSILTVRSCNEQFQGSKHCEDGDIELVYDERTELVFRNYQCALCNSVERKHMIPFVKMVIFDDYNLTEDNLADNRSLIDNSHKSYQVLPLFLETYSRCQPKIYWCEVQVSDALRKACLAYQSGVRCYSNPHCEQCSDSYVLQTVDPEFCPFVLGRKFTKPTLAIFIDSSGGLTTVYKDPTTLKDKTQTESDRPTIGVVLPLFNVSADENATKQNVLDTEQNEGVTAVYHEISFGVTLTGIILSIISIVIALLTFYMFPSMRNTSGWINILLLITILLRCFLYLLLLIDKEVLPACRAVAIAQHFCLLCTFCWINCLGSNIFLSTKPKPVFSKKVQKKLFLYYCLYSFCTPALIVICCVAVEYSSIEVATTYEYSECFLTNKAINLAFIAPISVMMLVNATLYAMIIRNIKKKSHVKKEESVVAKNKRHKFEIILSIKICCAFALYWMFGIIATLIVTLRGKTTTASLVLNMIFVFTASMQGVFVCVAVVFNERVFNLWKKKILRTEPKSKLQKV